MFSGKKLYSFSHGKKNMIFITHTGLAYLFFPLVKNIFPKKSFCIFFVWAKISSLQNKILLFPFLNPLFSSLFFYFLLLPLLWRWLGMDIQPHCSYHRSAEIDNFWEASLLTKEGGNIGRIFIQQKTGMLSQFKKDNVHCRLCSYKHCSKR